MRGFPSNWKSCGQRRRKTMANDNAGKATAKRDLEERLPSIRALIDRSMNDPKPNIPAEEVFDRLKKMHKKNLKTAP